MTLSPLCHAGMHRLSEIQDGIFHLRPKLLKSDTDKTDRYIDDEQAEQIAALSRVEPYTPADEDYQFSIVDSLLLDTDLVLDYGKDSDCLFCAKTRFAYLSRNNYKLSQFTGEKKRPEIFSVLVHTREPFRGEYVDALSTTVINHRVYGDTHHTVKPSPVYGDYPPNGKTYYTGEMEGGYVHVIHACWTVWRHSYDVNEWPMPGYPYNGKCEECLENK